MNKGSRPAWSNSIGQGPWSLATLIGGHSHWTVPTIMGHFSLFLAIECSILLYATVNRSLKTIHIGGGYPLAVPINECGHGISKCKEIETYFFRRHRCHPIKSWITSMPRKELCLDLFALDQLWLWIKWLRLKGCCWFTFFGFSLRDRERCKVHIYVTTIMTIAYSYLSNHDTSRSWEWLQYTFLWFIMSVVII